jgi:recombination protein RecA
LPVHPADYEEIVARVNRKYNNAISRGDQIENPPRISTGSLELDVAMGGGMPVGRWVRFYGAYSSTKTLRALITAREAQKLGFTVAYYNIEKQYDPVFAAEKIGLNTKELTVVQGTTVEEIGEKMEALFGVVHFHIVDSCSVAVSEDELNADIRDWRPGIGARAWGKVFRRLNERFDQSANTVILIDQVRVNFRTGGEDPAGGKIFDHQSSMSVMFKKGEWLWRNAEGYLDEKAKQVKGMSGQIEPAGMEIKARIEKSRVCRPFRTATLRLDLDSMVFDDAFELAKAAKHYGVVESSGTWYEWEGHRCQGLRQLRQLIDSDVGLAEEVREKSLTASRF